MTEKKFISEPLEAHLETLSAADLAAGEPSLPDAFTWRERKVAVAEVLAKENVYRVESFSNEKYLRRHRFRLRMEDGAIWEVYFTRQPPRKGTSRKPPRWFLHTIEETAE